MVSDAQPEPARLGAHLSIVAPASEHRLGGSRAKVMIPAKIVCADGITHACVIRDMSTAGAKLAVSRRHALPRDFALLISGSDHEYPVTRMWRRGDFTGVRLGAPTQCRDAG